MTEALLRGLLLAAHLLAGAVAGGAPVLGAAVAAWRPGPPTADLARRALGWGLVAMLVSLLVGFASAVVVLVVDDVGYLSAAARVPLPAYGMLASEWLFSLALYGAAWKWWGRLATRPWLGLCVAFVSATNLVYHFATLMVVLGALADDPALAPTGQVTRPVFRSMIVQPLLALTTLHFVGLCLTAGAAFVARLAVRGPGGDVASGEASGEAAGGPAPDAWRAASRPLGATLLFGVAWQVVTGVGLVGVAPAAEVRGLFGAHPVATPLFVLSLWITVGLVHTAAGMLVGEGPRRARCWAATAAIATLMTLARAVATTG